jgi:alpha-glucosidase
MRTCASVVMVLALFSNFGLCQSQTTEKFDSDTGTVATPPHTSWWAGIIEDGFKMPLTNGYVVDVRGDNHQNQVQPLLLSNQGDVIWSPGAFKLEFDGGGKLLLDHAKEEPVIRSKAGNSLREAFLFASRNYFPPSGKTPDELLFSSPQYNTWIELMYDQNQKDILKYAQGIKSHGFPAGVMMIDDNWQEDYGKWDFNRGKFSDPKAMVAALHADGFKVMLWVCPFVSPDCDVYRDLAEKELLVKDDSGEPAIIRWWNGASAVLDLTNPKAVEWFRSRLDYLRSTYLVDGFKFDGGDSSFYCGIKTARAATPNLQTALYGEIGLHYPLNEYRAMWKMGGQPLGERLSDKAHSWEDLGKLIPNMILEGLMGYPFSCPDMIGGGSFTSFLPGKPIDQELIVRSAQCQALMPMMQFSVAPWRVLDESHLKAVIKAIGVRDSYKNYILNLARTSAVTGEPLVRSMEYAFPHRGYAQIKDQFLLGEKILVAPILEKNVSGRKVILPPGTWKGFNGEEYEGPGTIFVRVSDDDLCFFEKVTR